jgi:hypothetical protein
VPFELDGRDEADPRERMRGIAELAMAKAQEAIDAAASQDVVAIAAAAERRALEHPEVRLDEIEPAGLGRGEDERDAKAPGEREEARVVVDADPARRCRGTRHDRRPNGRSRQPGIHLVTLDGSRPRSRRCATPHTSCAGLFIWSSRRPGSPKPAVAALLELRGPDGQRILERS